MKNKDNIKNANIQTSFTGGSLTNYSGIYPIFKFMKSTGIFDLLSTIKLQLHHNAKYTTTTLYSVLLLGLMSGANRIKKIESFSRDTLVHTLFNIDDKIDEDTIANRLKRFTQKETCELMDINGKISRKVHKRIGTESDILDLDWISVI